MSFKDNIKRLFHFGGEAIEGLSIGAGLLHFWHLYQASQGKEIPNDAHPVFKLIRDHGGKKSWSDEAEAYASKRHDLTRSELDTLLEFDLWIQRQYGDGFFGSIARNRLGNTLRPGLLHLIEDEAVLPTKISNDDGTTSSETIQKSSVNLKHFVTFHKDLVREIRLGRRKAVGSEEEKADAGFQRGITFYEAAGFPGLPLADVAKAADEILETLPADAKRIITSGYEGVGSWIDQKHDELEERNNRKGALAGFRRWYRSLR
jgi:hypothetical protein